MGQVKIKQMDTPHGVLCKLSLHDSSTSLCVWFCIHIGYRGITNLCQSSLHDSLILLYRYSAFLHECSLFVVHMGILFLRELSSYVL